MLFRSPTNIATMPGQIQDRVADNLAWTMISDVPAAVRFTELHIHLRKQTIASSQMFRPPVAAERDDMRVLAEQQNVGYFICLASRDDPLLQFVGTAIGDQPEFNDRAFFR